ncbi:MAG: copper resistance protein CopC [Gammaproteobacteria bacterium]
MNRLLVWFGMMLLFGVLASLWQEPAYAHARLVKSVPAQRAVLKTLPKEIKLWFSEKLEPAYSSIVVIDQQGKPVSTPPAAVAPADPKLMVLPLESLAPGVYQIQYRVLSVDGHVVEAGFSFTFQPAP